MRYEIQLSPDAVDDLRFCKANIRARVLDGIEQCLRYEPEKESKSRIKRLKGLSSPQYRLRVDDYRVYYDVTGSIVEIIALVSKEGSVAWLEREGVKQ
ncbi:MAG: type II toxin-antitoxin system RelE/ParE family toxin [Anaerolineales bacterium]